MYYKNGEYHNPKPHKTIKVEFFCGGQRQYKIEYCKTMHEVVNTIHAAKKNEKYDEAIIWYPRPEGKSILSAKKEKIYIPDFPD